jgi:hypothetical protein
MAWKRADVGDTDRRAVDLPRGVGEIAIFVIFLLEESGVPLPLPGDLALIWAGYHVASGQSLFVVVGAGHAHRRLDALLAGLARWSPAHRPLRPLPAHQRVPVTPCRDTECARPRRGSRRGAMRPDDPRRSGRAPTRPPQIPGCEGNLRWPLHDVAAQVGEPVRIARELRRHQEDALRCDGVRTRPGH